MILGLRKERKPGENRVALTPKGVNLLLDTFPHLYVLVEHDAGAASGFLNNRYREERRVNNRIVIVDPETLFISADILLGVKEILPEEYHYFRHAKQGSIVACFWHVLNPAARDIMIKNKLKPHWFEDMPGVLGSMSTITGQMSVDIACHYLRKNFVNGEFIGRGTLPENATLTILGAAGRLGQAAYSVASQRFKKIILMDIKEGLFGPARLLGHDWREATEENIMQALLESDAVISGVHVAGKEAPKLITEEMMAAWGKEKPHAIFIDPAIDQGGSSETSLPTTHQNPIYLYPETSGVIHNCVANMPGTIPHTSTPALEKALLPNLIELIGKTAKEKQ